MPNLFNEQCSLVGKKKPSEHFILLDVKGLACFLIAAYFQYLRLGLAKGALYLTLHQSNIDFERPKFVVPLEDISYL